MYTSDDFPIGSLIRYKSPLRGFLRLNGQDRIGILIAFDHRGNRNPYKGKPVVLWTDADEPKILDGSILEVVS